MPLPKLQSKWLCSMHLEKTYGVPVHQLLGGLQQDRIQVRWALASGTPEGDIEEAKSLRSFGHLYQFQNKSGHDSPGEDALRNIRIAEGLNGLSTIGIDPNGSWDRITSMKWMDAFFEAGIDFLEQPLPPEDIEGLACLSSMKKVPIMADESLASVQDALRLAKKKRQIFFH